MNKKTTVGLLIFIVLVLGGGLAFALSSGNAEACEAGSSTSNWRMVIHDDKVAPNTITAGLCSKLTITNDDDKKRLIAFGEHDKHVAYDGVTEKWLDKNQSITITLDKTGEFHWHDHDDDTVEGYFTVTR